jgi:hypothetical protein
LLESRPHPSQLRSQTLQFLEGRVGDCFQELLAASCQSEAYSATVVGITAPTHEASLFSTPHELGRAVWLNKQVSGDVTDRGTLLNAMTPNSEEQLVLGWSKTRFAGLVPAPFEEQPQPGTEL